MTRLVVTGTTNGVGKAIAERLAADNHHVIMAVRDATRGHELRHELSLKHPNATIDVVECNLASRGSIDECADLILSRFGTIDVLINNAATMLNKPRLSESGYELTFATNHLGPFQLTNRLLPALTHDGIARVVVVSSGAHVSGNMDFDNLRNTDNYQMMRAYTRSKLANVMFANALARRTEDTNVRVNSLHPGILSTNILPAGSGLWAFFSKAAAVLRIMKPADRGANTPLYLALDPNAADLHGQYLDDHQIVQPCAAQASSINLQERLWGLSATATGVN